MHAREQHSTYSTHFTSMTRLVTVYIPNKHNNTVRSCLQEILPPQPSLILDYYEAAVTFMSREMRSRTQMQRIVSFNNKIKQRRTKTTPKGKNKQASRQAEDWNTVKHETLTRRRHMKDNGSAQDCRHKENYIGRQTRVTRETQLEPLKQ